MRKKQINIVFLGFLIILFNISNCFSVSPNLLDFGLFKIHSLYGAFYVESLYGYQTNNLYSLNGKESYSESKILRGNIRMNTNIYLITPRLLDINLGAEYSPSTQDISYLILPYTSESVNTQKFSFRSVHFSDLPVSFSLMFDIGKGYTKRNFSSDLEYNTKAYGGTLTINNPIIPINMSYYDNNWKETEIVSGDNFTNRSKKLNFIADKKFNDNYTLNANVAYEETTVDYRYLEPFENKISSANLMNQFDFNSSKNMILRNNFNFMQSNGDQDYSRYNNNISYNMDLPEDFKVGLGYNYINNLQDSIRQVSHYSNLKFENQVYLSLHSYIYFNNYYTSTNDYIENKNLTGGGLNYTKQIPTGRLSINYEGVYNSELKSTNSSSQRVYGEKHKLESGEVTILKYPLVDTTSIIIRNENGTITYIKDNDYYFIIRGNFVEIVRIPGGRIPDGMSIYVDYSVINQPSYDIESFSNIFDVKVQILDGLIQTYYKLYNNHFWSISNPEAKNFQLIDQQIIGIESRINNFTLGVEYESFDSNILPYIIKRFFVSFNGNPVDKLHIFLITNYKEIEYASWPDKQLIFDILNSSVYRLNSWSNLSLDFSYRYHYSRVPIHNLSMKSQIKMRLRSFIVSVGYDVYFEKFTQSHLGYQGLSLKIERSF